MSWRRTAALIAGLLLVGLGGTSAQDTQFPGLSPEGNEQAVRESTENEPSYSPYAGRSFPTRVFRGDTHLHTNNSLDARGLGGLLSADDAYRFAKGEELVASNGIPVKLGRPLGARLHQPHLVHALANWKEFGRSLT